MQPILSSKICVQLVGNQYVLLDQLEVMLAEADKQLCRITLSDGSKLTAGRHLGYYKKNLVDKYGFIEISRSILVNAGYIRKYHPKERLMYLSDGTEVVVAKGKQELMNQFFRRMHDHQSAMLEELPET